MQVSHRLTYKFEISARDLKMIRRALELEGSKTSKELSEKITAQVNRSLENLKIHFESLLVLEAKSPTDEESHE